MRTFRDRITVSLNQLTEALGPFVEKHLKTIYKDKWERTARESFRKDRSLPATQGETLEWDAQSVLTVMWDQWNSIFRHHLGHTERSLVSELREFRNRWAHQSKFNFDDTYRVLDSVHRLLVAIGSEKAEQIANSKRELLREEFSREMRELEFHSKLKQRKIKNIVTYFLCCLALISALFTSFGSSPVIWLLSFFVVCLFAFFIYDSLLEQTVIFGPHECLQCGKIIYVEPCPYCQKENHPKENISLNAEQDVSETETVAVG